MQSITNHYIETTILLMPTVFIYLYKYVFEGKVVWIKFVKIQCLKIEFSVDVNFAKKISCKMPNPDNSTLFISIFLPIVQNNLCVVGEKSGSCPHLCAKLYCHILLSSMFKIYDILWGQYHLFSFCIIPYSLFLSLFSFLYGHFDQKKNWKTKRKYLFLYASTAAQQ